MTTTAAWTWDDLTHSPWVEAVRQVLEDLPHLPDEVDVRDWVFPDRMPIDRLRKFLDFLQVPDTAPLSDDFTRRVGQNLFSYFQRNSWLAVDRTAEDLQFVYTADWRAGDRDHPEIPSTRRTALDFCITPSPLVEPDERYIAAVANWLRWTLPYLEGEVRTVDDREGTLRPRIKLSLCPTGELDLPMDLAVRAVVRIDLPTTKAV